MAIGNQCVTNAFAKAPNEHDSPIGSRESSLSGISVWFLWQFRVARVTIKVVNSPDARCEHAVCAWPLIHSGIITEWQNCAITIG